MTPNDPAQNTPHVYDDKCNNAGRQFHCSQEVAGVHQRNFICATSSILLCD